MHAHPTAHAAPSVRSAAERSRSAVAPSARATAPASDRLVQLAAVVQPVSAATDRRAANRTGLPAALKAGIERLSGQSLDHVRVHRNSPKPAQLQAHAYAQGGEIHLAPGQEKHLPHEAWHVAQQAQGRVRPTRQLKSVAINDDASLEREADTMGARAAQLKGTAAKPSPSAPVGNTTAQPVLQAFWVRIGGGDPEWRKDYLFRDDWYVQAQVTLRQRRPDRKKKKGFRNVEIQRPETRFTLTRLDSLPVYQPKGGMAPRLTQINGWLATWSTAKTTAILARYPLTSQADFALVAKHAPELTAMSDAQVDELMEFPKAVVDVFLRELNAGQLTPRITQMDSWRAAWKTTKADAVFATYNLGHAADFALITKHAANLAALDASVVLRLMQRNKPLVDDFLTFLDAGRLPGYFRGTLARQQALVDSNNELQSLVQQMRSQQAFDQAAVLPLNPTAAQGAHYLHEHGAHNSAQQTIELAVRYNLRGGGGGMTTKGNWVSNEAASIAMGWAKQKTTAEIQAAQHQNTAGGSLAHLPGTHAVGHAPIFGKPATDTALIYNNVSTVLAGAADYQHAAVSGTAGAATVVVRGDFQPEAGGLQVGAYAANFIGKLTGAALADGVADNGQALRILYVNGSGEVAVALTGQTQANKQIAGQMIGTILAQNAHVSFRTGNGVGTRFFNGTGDYHGMVSAPIAAPNSSWTYGFKNLAGEVHQQTLTDGCGNSVTLRKAPLAGPNLGNWGVGAALVGAAQAYTPGSSHEIAAGKARNLHADITNHTGGGLFAPDSLQAIVSHAPITGRISSYKRAAANNSLTGRLLATSIAVDGTLADLHGVGLNHGVLDLSSLNLQVSNVTAGGSLMTTDISTVPVPVQGKTYKIQIDGQWYRFLLAHFTMAPAKTNFFALLHLKNQNAAEYEPFTAYPK